MELYTELTVADLEAWLRKGIGHFSFKAAGSCDMGPLFAWSHGDVVPLKTGEEEKTLLQRAVHVGHTCAQLYFSPNPSYEGSLNVYQMMAIAVDQLSGDLALVYRGTDLDAKRVNGKLSLNKELSEEQRAFFKKPYELVSFPPLP